MNTSRDPDRLISTFLAEGQTELPDRAFDAVRSEIDRTRQRVVIGPWRTPHMNTLAKLATAAAAVAVVAIVGYNLLPANRGVGGGPASSPSLSPTPQPSPSTTPAAAMPPPGPLSVGTYTIVVEGIPASFSVPAPGWAIDRFGSIGFGEGDFGQPDSAGLNFWQSAPENVYADPCAHTPLSPLPAASAAGLAAAAATIPGTDLITGPGAVTVGGHPAQHVVFTIREDIACDPKEFYLWYDESTGGASGGWRWGSELGSTHQVWIIDVDGVVVWIDSETFKGGKLDLDQQIQQIVDSIQFE